MNISKIDLKNLKLFINYKFKNDNFKKKYFNKIKKIINFSKKNLNFLYYDQIYFYLYKFNLNHINKFIWILKKFKINIYENIPDRINYIKNLNFNNKYFNKIYKINKIYKDSVFEKIYFKKKYKININLNYKFINKILKNIKKKIFFKFFIFKTLIFGLKFKKEFIKNFNKNDGLEKYFKLIFFKKKYNIKIKNKNKIFYNFCNYIKKYIKIKKNDLIKSLKFDKNLKLNFNWFFFNKFYNFLLKYYEYIKKIKYKLYDIVINLVNISLIKFNFYFNKNGTDINWIINMINFSNFNKKFEKKIIIFIKKCKKKLKIIEKKIKMSIILFIKIFCYIDINKFKIDNIKNKIIENNLYLVKLLTKKYYKKDSYWDYIQAGTIGLINSINKFDYKYKNFKTFTILNIKSNISKFIHKNDRLIRLPSYIINLANKINKVIKNYFDKYKENPNLNFIKKKLNIPKKQIKRILNLYKDPISIESKLNNEDNLKIIDYLKDENINDIESRIFNEQIKEFFKMILDSFDEKSKNLLSMIYGINNLKKHSLKDIMLKYKISYKEIKDLKKLFISKITHPKLIKSVKKIFDY